jgi:transcriptional regulator with XRE-family HTH domain
VLERVKQINHWKCQVNSSILCHQNMRNVEIRREIGERLLEERTRLGLTQQGLADAIAGSRLSVIHYESGRSSPSAETLSSMESFGIDVRYVLTGTRQVWSSVDRERFRMAFVEAQRQATERREKLTHNASLDLAWSIYDSLDACRQVDSRI